MAKATKRKTVKSVKTPKTLKVKNLLEAVNVEMVKDEISELRMEMTHYVNESIAVSILALLLFIGAPSVFPEIINPYLPSSLMIMQAFVAVPSVFLVITILGNMVRYFKILKLKDSLK